MKIAAFVLPLAVWCVVSYVPWIWHPMVLISDASSSPYRVGDRLPRQDFAELNARLHAEGKPPAVGERANPVFLPAPHEVGKAMYLAFA